MDERDLLRATASYAADFLERLGDRRVTPDAAADDVLERLGGPLPQTGGDRAAAAILEAAAVPA